MKRLISAIAVVSVFSILSFATDDSMSNCPTGGATGGAYGTGSSTGTESGMGGASGGAYGAGSSTATSTGTGSSMSTSTGTAGGATGGAVETSSGTAGGATGGAAGSTGETGAAGAGATGAAVGTAGGATGGAGGETTKDRKWMLGIEGGYSTVNMKEVNDNYTALIGPLGSVTKIENGYDAALELMYKWDKRFAVGPRIEYLMTNQGKLSTVGPTIKEDLSLMPVLIGGRYMLKEMGEQTDVKNVSFNDRWDLNIGAFVGWAWAWGQRSDGTTLKYTGSGVAGDALLGWNYRLSRDWTLGLDVGYRYAPIDEMKYSEDNPGSGVRKDDTVRDQNDNKLKYDFCGLIANIGVGFKF